MTRSLILVFLVALLAGCGKKGPLYLPADKPQAVPGNAASPVAEKDKNKAATAQP